MVPSTAHCPSSCPSGCKHSHFPLLDLDLFGPGTEVSVHKKKQVFFFLSLTFSVVMEVKRKEEGKLLRAIKRKALSDGNVNMFCATPEARRLLFPPTGKHRTQVLTYLPSQKGTLITVGGLGIAPGSEVGPTAWRQCQGSQLRRC